jgi:hypothetical protein
MSLLQGCSGLQGSMLSHSCCVCGQSAKRRNCEEGENRSTRPMMDTRGCATLCNNFGHRRSHLIWGRVSLGPMSKFRSFQGLCTRSDKAQKRSGPLPRAIGLALIALGAEVRRTNHPLLVAKYITFQCGTRFRMDYMDRPLAVAFVRGSNFKAFATR